MKKVPVGITGLCYVEFFKIPLLPKNGAFMNLSP